MTLLVRDEADILDAQLAFHLNAGVDFVIATDHRSDDGTTEILERYANEGWVHLLREESSGFRQAEWASRMAQLAATDFGADWVINADADEFWWPRGGSLKDILECVPPRFGIVRCFERHFAPRPSEHGHFAERMTVRVTPYARQTGPEDPFQMAMQVIHRADPFVTLMQGNHDVTSGGLLTLRGWYPFEVLHFPLRTCEQSRRKFEHKRRATQVEPTAVGLHMLSAGRAIEEGRFDEWYSRYVVDETTLAQGLVDDALAIDTRLRDALRRLAGVPELSGWARDLYAVPATGTAGLEFAPDDVAAAARYAHELEPFDEWDSQRRFLRRVAELERRLVDVERGLGVRVRERLFRVAGRRR